MISNCSDKTLQNHFYKGLCKYSNGSSKKSKLTEYQFPEWTEEAQKRQDLSQVGLDLENDFPGPKYNQTWTDIERTWLNYSHIPLKQPDLRSGELYKATAGLLLLGGKTKPFHYLLKTTTLLITTQQLPQGYKGAH